MPIPQAVRLARDDAPMIHVRREGDTTTLALLAAQASLRAGGIRQPDGSELLGWFARFVDEQTGLAFEVFFDDEGWKAFVAQKSGLVIADRMPIIGNGG